MRVSSVFHLANHRPPADAEVLPAEPIPPPRKAAPFTPRLCGHWQTKALGMEPGQSLILEREPANTFRRACKGLGFTTTQRTEPDGRFRVYLVSKGP